MYVLREGLIQAVPEEDLLPPERADLDALPSAARQLGLDLRAMGTFIPKDWVPSLLDACLGQSWQDLLRAASSPVPEEGFEPPERFRQDANFKWRYMNASASCGARSLIESII